MSLVSTRLALPVVYFAAAWAAAGAAACAAPDDGATAAGDNDPPLADRDELFDGAPSQDEIPSEWKTDEVLPASFDIRATQSPVKAQGQRGVCSIFSAIGLMEHLYLVEGSLPDPDFSEQFLQWSVKSELRAFPGSSGSNSSYNLQALNRFGVPLEGAWPYETAPWTTANDPACVSDEDAVLPTQCHTNGAPPASAAEATRYFLPTGRYLSTRDIKAHIHNRKHAVTVGFDFFYQAWNHRKSTLPTNPQNWNDGIVLYPNEEDRRVSLEKRAGHEILIIGWDDEMEVPVRDAAGAVVVGADGEPVVEKGFYLFKNSWGTVGFGIENPFGAGYGWIAQRYVADYASARVSDLPQPVAADEVCDDGVDNDRDQAIDCDDADCAAAPACETVGGELTFDGPAGLSIPDNDPAGVAPTIDVTDAGTVRGLTVRVAIDHTYRGDLRVVLEQGGKSVTLHDRVGGSADDLALTVPTAAWDGAPLAGTWTLRVVDTARIDTGVLESWSLTATVD